MTSSIYCCDKCHKQFSSKKSLSGHKRVHSKKIIQKKLSKISQYQNFTSVPDEIFLDNKYTKLYYSIINNARHKTYNCYTEKHHILPKSLGGSDDWSNIITLSAREHFICHYLLTKITDNNFHKKMLHAFMLMKGNTCVQDRYFNSYLYENSKINFSKLQIISQCGENNSQYGTIWVTNFTSKQSIKIPKEKFAEYSFNGFIKGRCINFANFDKDGHKISKKPKSNRKYISKCKSISEFYNFDNINKIILDNISLSLSELSKMTSLSRIAIHNRLKKYRSLL